jgi:hypothetical protein
MRYEIKKDRLWIFSPVADVIMKADIAVMDGSAGVSIKELKEAIACAVNSNEVLKSKVILEEDGKAYFTEMPEANYMVTESNQDWKAIIREQERIPFDLSKGEYLRIYLIRNGEDEGTVIQEEKSTAETVTLLLIAHHLAGDGLSFAYLIQDIMKALCKEELVSKPVQLLDLSHFPKESRLNFPMKLMMNGINRSWRKTGKSFTLEEFREMNAVYWSQNSTHVTTYAFTENRYIALTSAAKKNNVTMNSLITTALIKAAKECGETGRQDVGFAVSIRQKGYTGMGNYASGASLQYLYDEGKDFYENARRVQKQIYHKIKDNKKKYFLLQFLENIEGTLNDAVYFAAVSGYDNRTARTFSKMFGYGGNPKGISITNLTRLPLEAVYGKYELAGVLFIPPVVLNAKRIIGVASLGNRMEISFCVREDRNCKENILYFNRAMDILEKLMI